MKTPSENPSNSKCPKCSATFTQDAKFCPQCGWNLSLLPTKVPSTKLAVVALLVSAGLFGVAWSLANSLAGNQPKTTWAESRRSELSAIVNDPNIVALREQTKNTPSDLKAWRSLAKALGEKIISMPEAPNELAEEMFQVLFKIVELDPKDAQALVTLGNMHYNHQDFAKARELLTRYLELVPDDHDSRATLGSALTFLGKYGEAEQELQKVLSADSKHFVAKANLAINLSEKGDTVRAKAVGDEALALAPDEDSREKLAMFLGHMKAGKDKPHDGSSPATVHPLADFISKNPIAGPKFVDASLEGEVLTVRFKDFPMSAMPPFAKEKFFAGIKKEAATQSEAANLSSVQFVDSASGSVMESLKLRD